MPIRTIHEWFAEYGESHRNETNTMIHWICVPAIYFSIVGLLVAIPSPFARHVGPHALWAYIAIIGVMLFYARRSLPVAAGMAVWSFLCVVLAFWVRRHAPWPLWSVCVGVFVLAWVGQFYGHKIEGKKPSFLKDLQFLLIGPAWLMSKLYRRFGIAY